MSRRSLFEIVLLAVLTVLMPDPGLRAADAESVIALERGALDRWGRGDPHGYLELYATDVTYFDPLRERRVNGLETMRKLLEPIKGLVKIDRYEMIEPRVQLAGDAAILTYNLVSYGRRPDGTAMVARWNVTSVYVEMEGRMRTVHGHFSFTQPALKEP